MRKKLEHNLLRLNRDYCKKVNFTVVTGKAPTTICNRSANGVLDKILVTGVNLRAKMSFKGNTATVWKVPVFLQLCISCALELKC